MTNIPFNKPHFTGREISYVKSVINSGKVSGDGVFTKKCQAFMESSYGFGKVLLTNSCTDALEMTAILSNIKEGDEVIAPSFTYVSTVNPFVLRGATIVFADSSPENPNINTKQIENLITNKTKAIVVVHYGGIACDMDTVMDVAKRHNLLVIEDAAQCIDAFYKNKALGTIGQFGAFSFHESKNITAGEGGMFTCNDKDFIERAYIILEKGTNRKAFFEQKLDKYEWVDIGSSFPPSEIMAAMLNAQLENLFKIQQKRKRLWLQYHKNLQSLATIENSILPYIPAYATHNAHMYYIVCRSITERKKIIAYLEKNGIQAVFHYQSLHKSPFYKNQYKGAELTNADRYSDCLLRFPLYYDLKLSQVDYICEKVISFYQ